MPEVKEELYIDNKMIGKYYGTIIGLFYALWIIVNVRCGYTFPLVIIQN